MWHAPRTVLVLDVYIKDRRISCYGFTKRTVTVGRSTSCDLRLDHPGISRHQFRIRREHEAFLLTDCRSANGTFVNRQRVGECLLTEGDEVEAGKYTLRVSLREQSEYDGADPERGTGQGVQMPTVRAPHLRADFPERSEET